MSHFIERTGYCKDGYTEFLGCALEPDECKSRTADFEPKVLTGERCDPNKRRMGRCLKENTCAVRASDCSEDTSEDNFDKDDENCTFQRDKSLLWDINNPTFTQFGSCKNTITGEYFCIFDPLDCDESGNEVYVTPAETKAVGVSCDCSDVHVTACQYDGMGSDDDVMCAVKSESCAGYDYWDGKITGDPFTSLSPNQQRLNRDDGVSSIDCRLCIKKDFVVEPTTSSSGTEKDTSNITSAGDMSFVHACNLSMILTYFIMMQTIFVIFK